MHDEQRTGASSRSATGPRVLLVTPDPVLGVALSQYLSGFFAKVAVATSVATAVAMLGGAHGGRAAGRYAAVVVDADALDAAVPAPDGAADEDPFARLLRGRPGLRGRIVLLGAPRRSAALGAREVLAKPAPGEELVRALDTCVGPGLRKALSRPTGARARHI